jgi:hypothetical protein
MLGEFQSIRDEWKTNVLDPQKQGADETAEKWREKLEEIKTMVSDFSAKLEVDVVTTGEFEETLAKLNELTQTEKERRVKLVFRGEASPERPLIDTINAIENRFNSLASLVESPLHLVVKASEAVKTLEKVQDLLDGIKDKTVTVKVNYQKISKDVSDTVAGFKTGGRIPGFGGGDIFRIAVEGGEYVLNKHATRYWGADLLSMMNNMQLKFSDLPKALASSTKTSVNTSGKFKSGGLTPSAPTPALTDLGKISLSVGGKEFPVMGEINVLDQLKTKLEREKLLRGN